MRKIIIPCLFFALIGSVVVGSSCLEDNTGITKTLQEYRTAWLANDEARVMKTLTEDAILMPANSKTTVEGSKAIRNYWWPAGSPFSIDEFDQPLLETVSCGELGYARGTSRVAWTSTNNGVVSKSVSTTNFLAVMKKDHGLWRISRLTWYQTN